MSPSPISISCPHTLNHICKPPHSCVSRALSSPDTDLPPRAVDLPEGLALFPAHTPASCLWPPTPHSEPACTHTRPHAHSCPGHSDLTMAADPGHTAAHLHREIVSWYLPRSSTAFSFRLRFCSLRGLWEHRLDFMGQYHP